jgi:hypothetical protein
VGLLRPRPRGHRRGDHGDPATACLGRPRRGRAAHRGPPARSNGGVTFDVKPFGVVRRRCRAHAGPSRRGRPQRGALRAAVGSWSRAVLMPIRWADPPVSSDLRTATPIASGLIGTRAPVRLVLPPTMRHGDADNHACLPAPASRMAQPLTAGDRQSYQRPGRIAALGHVRTPCRRRLPSRRPPCHSQLCRLSG